MLHAVTGLIVSLMSAGVTCVCCCLANFGFLFLSFFKDLGRTSRTRHISGLGLQVGFICSQQHPSHDPRCLCSLPRKTISLLSGSSVRTGSLPL